LERYKAVFSAFKTMTQIDRQNLNRLVREVADALDEAKSIVSMDIDKFSVDRRARYSLRYSVVVVVEALADLSVAILEKDFSEDVESYREAFLKLTNHGVISFKASQNMAKLASLRNQIVHRYWTIDDLRIYKEAKENGLGTIERFIKEMTDYVETKDP